MANDENGGKPHRSRRREGFKEAIELVAKIQSLRQAQKEVIRDVVECLIKQADKEAKQPEAPNNQ
jgi:hypothetical protein